MALDVRTIGHTTYPGPACFPGGPLEVAGGGSFPGSGLFPGPFTFPDNVSRYGGIFRPPTQEQFFRLENGLTGRFTQGLSVWRVNGVWAQGQSPSADTVAAADRYYAGGREHHVDPIETAELLSGGFANYITLEVS